MIGTFLQKETDNGVKRCLRQWRCVLFTVASSTFDLSRAQHAGTSAKSIAMLLCLNDMLSQQNVWDWKPAVGTCCSAYHGGGDVCLQP
jgi:hypothetical protein